MFDTQRDIILFLNYARISNLKILNIISENMLHKFFDFKTNNLEHILFLNEQDKLRILDSFQKLNINGIKYNLQKFGIKYITIIDENYPDILRSIYDAPSILYYKGKDIEFLENCISVVGTRKPTEYGLYATKKIVEGFKNYDVNIVSGMALGIDYQAHHIALENNIPTVGVLASSLDIIYPKTNLSLYNRMENSLLISEFPLSTSPIKRNFIFRNRIISGLSYATIVIEAMDQSGSLVTSKYATEQNRDVFAVPGNINSLNSLGTNQLLKRGAKPITEAYDLLQELDFIKEKSKIDVNNNLNVDSKMIKILNLLKNDILSIDEIYTITKIPINELYSIILQLEFKGYIYNVKDNLYTIN